MLNDIDSLDLFFDTGASGIVLTHPAIKDKTHLLSELPSDYKIVTYAPLPSLSTLTIGTNTWDSLNIYPVTVTGQETDGHFGWNLFTGRIVELDYDNNIMIIHDSLSEAPKGYTRLDIEYTHTLFCVQGTLHVQGENYKSRYLFDSGYQRTIVLDSVLRNEQNFPKDLPTIKTTSLRNGAGKVFYTKIVNSDWLQLGEIKAENIPTQLLDLPNPAQFKTHILGNELLMRFNTILDFKNHHVYLKPNKLMTLLYVDAKI